MGECLMNQTKQENEMSKRANRENQLERYMECRELLEASGCQDDPVYRDLIVEMAASPLQGGAKAEMAANLAGRIMGPKAAANAMGFGRQPLIPHVDPNDGICIGLHQPTGTPIVVPFEAFTQHALLLGGTGYGKTNIAAVVKSQVPSRIFFEFIDSKKEGSRFFQKFPKGVVLDPSQFYENPWEPVGDPLTSRLTRFEKIAPIARLDDRTWPDAPGLFEAVESSMPPGVPGLSPEQSLVVLDNAGKKKDKYNTLSSRLRPFVQALGSIGARVCTGPDVRKIFSWACLDYSHQSPLVKHMWEACRIDKRLQQMSAAGHTAKLTCLTLYDELVDFFAKEFTESKPGSRHVSFFKTALSQCRSFGWGLFFCSQFPSQLGAGFAANIGIIIVMHLQDRAEARTASQMLGAGDELVETIQHLDKGEFIIGGNSFPQPIQGKAPLYDLGEYPKESDIKAAMEPHLAHLESLCVLSPERPPQEYNISFEDVFPECCPDPEPDTAAALPSLVADHEALLRDCVAHPGHGVADHYKNLGWSATKGGRVRDELLAHKFIAVERKSTGDHRPRDLWMPTDLGKEYLHGLS